MEFLYDYGLFLLKTATMVCAFAVVIGLIANVKARQKGQSEGELKITKVNDELDEVEAEIQEVLLEKTEFKKLQKDKQKKIKQEQKRKSKDEDVAQKRIFVLDFYGDIHASNVEHLREEISAILLVAKPSDEVIVKLESAGGVVHQYGLAASQLLRLKEKKIHITACIDRVAASGGYMMACVADKIIAAPFAVLGSIGVVAQLPNFNRLLKKYDVDYEQITAGDYKRTLTLLGENTEAGRKKFQEEIDDTHLLFKEFVSSNREINLEQVATGEHWFATRAKDFNLVDTLQTSDDYLLSLREQADIYEVTYEMKETLADKFSHLVYSMKKTAENALSISKG